MNAFILSVRYIRSRKLESSLGIFGIVLGVATLAGTLSLITSYESYYDNFSRSPESRQIRVVQSSRIRVTDSAAALIGTTEVTNIQFTADEAKAALALCPDVENFYQADYRSFNTTANTSSSSGFDGPGGFGPPAPAAAATGNARASIGANGAPADARPNDGMFGRSTEVIDTTLEKPTLETINGAMVSGGFFSAYTLRAKYGDIFSDSADNSGVPGVVLGASLAQKVYASVTDPSLLIGKKLILNNSTYNIIGVLENDPWNSSGRNITFNEMAFVPTYEMRAGAGARARYRNIIYTSKESGTPSRAAIELENYFNSIHGEGTVNAEANLDRFYKELTKRERILTLMAILASASALTAAINLFNLMTSRVVRRHRPIAIMRAIGAWNMRVFSQIMLEAAMIGTIGAIGGIALSPLVVRVLGNMLENSATNQSIPVSVNLPVLVLVGFGALCISLIFAAIPAKTGSSLVITDALRSE